MCPILRGRFPNQTPAPGRFREPKGPKNSRALGVTPQPANFNGENGALSLFMTSSSHPPQRDRQALAFAAFSICMCGWKFAEEMPIYVRCLGVLVGLLTFWSTYRFNDFIDDGPAMDGQPAKLELRRQSIGCGLLGLSLALLLPWQSAVVVVLLLAIGFLYSGPRKNAGLKRYVGYKNAITGLGWGLLVLLPNGAELDALWLMLFASTQVFIGSVLRDLTDAQEDEQDGLATLANRWGRDLTYRNLGLINLGSISIIVLGSFWGHLSPIIGLVVLWRAFQLRMDEFSNLRAVHRVRLNLLTCHILAGLTCLF